MYLLVHDCVLVIVYAFTSAATLTGNGQMYKERKTWKSQQFEKPCHCAELFMIIRDKSMFFFLMKKPKSDISLHAVFSPLLIPALFLRYESAKWYGCRRSQRRESLFEVGLQSEDLQRPDSRADETSFDFW